MQKLVLSVLLLPLALWACSDSSVAPSTCPNFGSQGSALGVTDDFLLVAGSLSEDWRAVNLSGSAPVILPEFGLTGVSPNDLEVLGNDMFVVNSGDNTITRIDLETGANTGCIETGAGSNPWELFVDPQDATRGWLTTFASGELMELDLSGMSVIRRIAVEPGLEGLLVTDSLVVVTATGFDLTTFEYGQGSVKIFDKADLSERATLPVPMNPQFVLTGADGRAHVVCTGNFGFPAPGIFGKVVRLESDWSAVRDTLDIGSSPSRAALGPDGTVYLASFFGGVLSYDSKTFAAGSPVLTETGFTDVDVLGSHLYAANFDGDKVVRLNLAGTDTLDIQVGNDGPSAVAFREEP